jgi:hypothetical protein
MVKGLLLPTEDETGWRSAAFRSHRQAPTQVPVFSLEEIALGKTPALHTLLYFTI